MAHHPRIGLALGSGSARGLSHIGVLDALLEAGIEPDVVCGTSIGALVGAAYVAGQLDGLRHWAETATWRQVVRLMDVRLMGGGLIDGKQVVALLRRLGIDAPIESYDKRYAAVATDLASGREVWLQTGPIHEAVRASIALPGIVSPAQIDGKWLVDGGLTNPVPISVCRALGAEVIIAVNLNGDLVGRRFDRARTPPAVTAPSRVSTELFRRMLGQLPGARLPGHGAAPVAEIAPDLLPRGSSAPGYLDVLANSLNIMQDHITRTRLAGEPPDVLLVPRLGDIGLMEFTKAREAIAEGRHCVQHALPLLKRYV
ncbi:MAG: patatin-like phospholipase family protein [Reyranella sp.]|uniref:patatin-like phospholipase family protein n=1 Tax=Reyranella sp. TaxID=1929291 RepID=UPI002731F28F|nr:patatin-like phospholipase family protein [Reyranella sp.]MDP1966938.1 patatin-like phospholipase family protein [Reyranella sp.]MDP2375973.1 patatin-like phospholipase family protein [Reyranella sp.]